MVLVRYDMEVFQPLLFCRWCDRELGLCVMNQTFYSLFTDLSHKGDGLASLSVTGLYRLFQNACGCPKRDPLMSFNSKDFIQEVDEFPGFLIPVASPAEPDRSQDIQQFLRFIALFNVPFFLSYQTFSNLIIYFFIQFCNQPGPEPQHPVMDIL